MTPLQTKVFEFVRERCAVGLPPTFTEIGTELDMTVSSAKCHVDALIRAGKIGRNRHESRGLFVPGGPDLRSVSTIELKLELERRGEILAHVPSDRHFGGGRSCAVDCCQETVKVGRFFCPRHWFAIPRELRDEVLETFFAAKRDHRKQNAFQVAFARARDLADGARA